MNLGNWLQTATRKTLALSLMRTPVKNSSQQGLEGELFQYLSLDITGLVMS